MLDTLLTLIMRPLVKMQMDGKVPFAYHQVDTSHTIQC